VSVAQATVQFDSDDVYQHAFRRAAKRLPRMSALAAGGGWWRLVPAAEAVQLLAHSGGIAEAKP
jgi:hypothetical protein